MMAEITQDEIDALWLACRVEVSIGDVPRNLQHRAQLRIQRLADMGVIEHRVGGCPHLKGSTHE